MKTLLTLALFAGALSAQTATTASTALPGQVVGTGTSWLRGNAYPLTGDVTIGLRVGTTNFFSWTNISTPLATTPPGSAPTPSSITTGAAWLVAQSSSGKIGLLAIAQGGFTSVSSVAGVSAQITGSFAVPIKPCANKQLYIMLGVKLANQTASTAVVQPFVSILYGFNPK